MFKFILYFAITVLVIWSMDSININGIFKKNANPMQARLFYFFLALSIIYLVTNFLYDLFTCVKIF